MAEGAKGDPSHGRCENRLEKWFEERCRVEQFARGPTKWK